MRVHQLALRGLPVVAVALFGAVAASGGLRQSFQVGAAPSSAVVTPGTITITKIVDNASELALPSSWSFVLASENCGSSIESAGDPSVLVASRPVEIAGAGGSASIVVEANQFFLNGSSTPCTYQVTETAVAGWTTTPSLVQSGITVGASAIFEVAYTNSSATTTTTTLAPTTTTLAPTTTTTLAPTTTLDPTTTVATTTVVTTTLAPTTTTTVLGVGAGGITTTTAAGSGAAVPTTAGPTLPATGGNSSSTMLAALLVVALGGAAVLATRRRPTAPVGDHIVG